MTKSKRSVLLAVMVIVLCLSLIAGGTYALFSDSVKFSNHLEAGKMDLTLTRTTLTRTELGANGMLVVNEVQKNTDDPVDFSDTNTNSANIFGIADGVIVVPCSKYEATMKITNDSAKSSTAFGYYLEIVFDKATNDAFASQLRVTVTPDGMAPIVRYVNATDNIINGNTTTDTDGYIKVLELGQKNSHTFNVAVEFVDDETVKDANGNKTFINNDVKGETVKFDIVVHAVQVTGL